MNRDPLGEGGGVNLYAYAGNNPVSHTDAYGLSFTTFAQGFAVGFGVSFIVGLGIMALGGALGSAAALSGPASIPGLLSIGAALIGAAGVAAAWAEYYNIVNDPTLCPDERDHRLGLLVGGILGGLGAAKLGPKFRPKVGPKNTQCFVAGTQVLMADDSTKPIEQIKVGDWVLSRADGDKNGKVEAKQVKQVFVKDVAHTLKLKLSSGEEVETTGGHRFYTEDKGWLKAKEFGLGTSIVTRAGPSVQVLAATAKAHEKPVPVYNFEVEDNHTYFVGSSEMWAHNQQGPYRGGLHGTTKLPVNDGLDSHHMPADSISPVDRDAGPAIQMEPVDHRRTASWGSSAAAQRYRQQQLDLINQGRFDDAIQLDIDDVQDKFPNKYDEAILEMIDECS